MFDLAVREAAMEPISKWDVRLRYANLTYCYKENLILNHYPEVDMNEYETASLAIQEATLVLQQQGLIAAYVQAGAALLVGLAQCGLIAWGIRKMDASNQRRERQEVQAEARHEETMLALQQQGEALRTLIERTAPQK